MRTLIIGYGIQGKKRREVAGDDVVGIVDPVASAAQYRHLDEVPVDAYDIALLSVPDEEKVTLLKTLLSAQKPTLVEKPLLFKTPEAQQLLLQLSQKTLCYTAYNHRFEPHVQKIKELLQNHAIGKVYAMHLLYGNGTAANVRASPWRDQGLGVVKDLGSHLLDLLLYWDPQFRERQFSRVVHNCFENKAPDHAILQSTGLPYAHLTVMLICWQNTFNVDIWGEKGSIHLNGLCKWGPSVLTLRHRVLPSGKPESQTWRLEEPDNSWAAEYRHFLSLIKNGKSNMENDVWIEKQLC